MCHNDPSRTPPVETKTSRNRNARRILQIFRGNPHKLSRILLMCGDIRENSAKFCEHFCFDWFWFRLVASCSKRCCSPNLARSNDGLLPLPLLLGAPKPFLRDKSAVASRRLADCLLERCNFFPSVWDIAAGHWLIVSQTKEDH